MENGQIIQFNLMKSSTYLETNPANSSFQLFINKVRVSTSLFTSSSRQARSPFCSFRYKNCLIFSSSSAEAIILTLHSLKSSSKVSSLRIQICLMILVMEDLNKYQNYPISQFSQFDSNSSASIQNSVSMSSASIFLQFELKSTLDLFLASSISGSMASSLSSVSQSMGSSNSKYLDLSMSHSDLLLPQQISKVFNSNSGAAIWIPSENYLVAKNDFLKPSISFCSPRQSIVAQSLMGSLVSSSVRIYLNKLVIIFSISIGLLKNSLTLARNNAILSQSSRLPQDQTISSTASSICSPKSPMISIIAHRAQQVVTPRTQTQKVCSNMLNRRGYFLRKVLMVKIAALQMFSLEQKLTMVSFRVLITVLASFSSNLKTILVRALMTSSTITSSRKYSVNSLRTSAKLSLLQHSSISSILTVLTQVSSFSLRQNFFIYPRYPSYLQWLIKQRMCLRAQCSIQGKGWPMKERRHGLIMAWIFSVSSGCRFAYLRNILLMESTRARFWLRILAYSWDRICMISSSDLGSQSSMQLSKVASWMSSYPVFRLLSRYWASFLLIATPSGSIQFIASRAQQTTWGSLSRSIPYSWLRRSSSLTDSASLRLFSLNSLVSPIKQAFLTIGAKSARPCIKMGRTYSSRPLKRRLDRFLIARARMLGLGELESFVKVLTAMRAKSALS